MNSLEDPKETPIQKIPYQYQLRKSGNSKEKMESLTLNIMDRSCVRKKDNINMKHI